MRYSDFVFLEHEKEAFGGTGTPALCKLMTGTWLQTAINTSSKSAAPSYCNDLGAASEIVQTKTSSLILQSNPAV